MLRKAFSAFAGAGAAVVLFSVGIYLQLQFTPLGEFFRLAGQGREHELLSRFGDPIDALGRYVGILTWVVCPISVFLASTLARYIARRSSWHLAVSSALPVAAIRLIADFRLVSVCTCCFYILIGFGAMYLFDRYLTTNC
jgi:hypothetical protein